MSSKFRFINTAYAGSNHSTDCGVLQWNGVATLKELVDYANKGFNHGSFRMFDGNWFGVPLVEYDIATAERELYDPLQKLSILNDELEEVHWNGGWGMMNFVVKFVDSGYQNLVVKSRIFDYVCDERSLTMTVNGTDISVTNGDDNGKGKVYILNQCECNGKFFGGNTEDVLNVGGFKRDKVIELGLKYYDLNTNRPDITIKGTRFWIHRICGTKDFIIIVNDMDMEFFYDKTAQT